MRGRVGTISKTQHGASKTSCCPFLSDSNGWDGEYDLFSLSGVGPRACSPRVRRVFLICKKDQLNESRVAIVKLDARFEN